MTRMPRTIEETIAAQSTPLVARTMSRSAKFSKQPLVTREVSVLTVIDIVMRRHRHILVDLCPSALYCPLCVLEFA